jgi:hypothetical protein
MRFPVSEKITFDLYRRTGINPYPFSENQAVASKVMEKRCHRPYVTLTLRESPLNKLRNWEAETIIDFKRHLYELCKSVGFDLIVIPDMEGFHPADGGQTREIIEAEASFCLKYRFSLYRRAKLNVSTSLGPAALLYLSDAPHYIFGVVDKSVPVMSPDFFARKGPEYGAQRPWSHHLQYLDWTERGSFDPQATLERIASLLQRCLMDAPINPN